MCLNVLQVVKNITKLSEESKHSQADNTEKSQSTEVDIKVRRHDTLSLKLRQRQFTDDWIFFMLFSAFRQLQLIQNAAARAPTKIKNVDHISPGLRFLAEASYATKNKSVEWFRGKKYLWSFLVLWTVLTSQVFWKFSFFSKKGKSNKCVDFLHHNKLPENLRSALTFSSPKLRLKMFLFATAFYWVKYVSALIQSLQPPMLGAL